MNTINASRPFSREASVSRSEAPEALAFSIAKSGNELLESGFGAWNDQSAANASPVLEGYAALACVPLDE